jgi:hypothetical protein
VQDFIPFWFPDSDKVGRTGRRLLGNILVGGVREPEALFLIKGTSRREVREFAKVAMGADQ